MGNDVEEVASHQRGQNLQELLEFEDIINQPARPPQRKVQFQEPERSASEAATTRRSNRRRGVALEEGQDYIGWEGGAGRDESPTPWGYDQDPDYAPAEASTQDPSRISYAGPLTLRHNYKFQL